MIEVDRISKYFGHFPAIRDVSFHVDAGETLGFLGVNGAGKTTTMRILTGYYPPTSGSASVSGFDVFEDSLAVRKKIGYLPENVPLYDDMSVVGYLNFVARIKGVARSKRNAAVGRAMEDCQLEDVSNKYIKTLSKGYRQRVGLAQSLLGDPEVLILDEPTIGLDPKQIKEIRSLISSFAGEKTIILSTHILPEVSMTCHRVAIINRGRVLAEDTPENLCARLPGAGRILVRTSGPAAEVRETLSKVRNVGEIHLPDGNDTLLVEAPEDTRPQIAQAIIESGWSLYEMTPQTPTLEDVFIKLVTADGEEPEHV